MEITKKRRITEIIIGILVLVLFGFLYYATYQAYYNETYSRLAVIEAQKPDTENYVEDTAKIISVDPIKGEMQVRVAFEPMGELAKNNQLTDELNLYVNSATGGVNRIFPKGKDMSPIDVTLNMEGIVTDYPFDSHEANLELFLTKPIKDADPEDVPIALNFSGSVAGLRIDAELNKESAGNYALVDINVHRSQTTMVVTIAAMGLLWLVSFTVLFMLLAVLFRGRKIEFGMFAFMAGFLFSFVSFRNAMPGAPPIGTLSDYLAFFWGYLIITLSLVGLTITWLTKPPK